MDGKDSALDNIFVEILWRSVEYETVYLNLYENGITLRKRLIDCFQFYMIKHYINRLII